MLVPTAEVKLGRALGLTGAHGAREKCGKVWRGILILLVAWNPAHGDLSSNSVISRCSGEGGGFQFLSLIHI